LKTYPLKSVKFQGRTFSGCSIVLDAEAGKAEVLRPTGLMRKGEVRLVVLTRDSGAQVQIEGAVVRSGPIVVTAGDAATAEEIFKALQSEAAIKGQPTIDPGVLREPVSILLRKRQEGIEFLMELKRNPRQALVDKSSAFTGKYRDPAAEYLARLSLELAEAHATMDSAAAGGQETIGNEATNRILAFVYAVGALQDWTVRGGKQPAGLPAFLGELGIDVGVAAGLEASSSTEVLLQAAKKSLFLPFPAQEKAATPSASGATRPPGASPSG
jgi:hypothetical protein